MSPSTSHPSHTSPPSQPTPFGHQMRQTHFHFSPSYTPLNHGSYGAHPRPVSHAHNLVRDLANSAPDPFIALNFADKLNQQRSLVASIFRCPVEECVFVPNATTGIDTVLKNIVWKAGDVVVCYDVVYGSVANGLAWLREERGVEIVKIPVRWPVGDGELVRLYVDKVREINAGGSELGKGRRVRLAVLDTIVSMPGMRMPFEKLVPALQAEKVMVQGDDDGVEREESCMVMLDGAHGIGHIDINLSGGDAGKGKGGIRPDFFVSNLHKWFFVPRGCAVFVVRRDRQGLIRTSLPTSHAFRPRKPVMLGKGKSGVEEGVGEIGELGEEEEGDNGFVDMFEFTGTADTTNWLTVDAAIKFRNEVCGGEEAIREYSHNIAQQGAAIAAEIFGTDILDHPESCMRQCNFANVRLPIDVARLKSPQAVVLWIKKVGVEESGMFFQTVNFQGSFYWRISGMIYLEDDDYRRGAEVLKKLCMRVQNGEHAAVS